MHGRRGRTKTFREFYTINAAQTSPAGLLAGISSVLHAASRCPCLTHRIMAPTRRPTEFYDLCTVGG